MLKQNERTETEMRMRQRSYGQEMRKELAIFIAKKPGGRELPQVEAARNRLEGGMKMESMFGPAGTPIMTHCYFEVFIGGDDEDFNRSIADALRSKYAENPAVEVMVSKNTFGKTLVQARSVIMHKTGWVVADDPL